MELLSKIRKKINLKRIFCHFEQALLVTPLLLLYTNENYTKNMVKQDFHNVFFNFLWYLLIQSVPKYLGLFEHVGTFQFTICNN